MRNLVAAAMVAAMAMGCDGGMQEVTFTGKDGKAVETVSMPETEVLDLRRQKLFGGQGYITACGSWRNPFGGEITLFRSFWHGGNCNAMAPNGSDNHVYSDLNEPHMRWYEGDNSSMNDTVRSAKALAPGHIEMQLAFNKDLGGNCGGYWKHLNINEAKNWGDLREHGNVSRGLQHVQYGPAGDH